MSLNRIALAAAIFAAACGSAPEPGAAEEPAPASTASVTDSQPPPAPTTEPSAAAAPVPPTAPATSGSTTLRFFDNVLESDQPTKPSFELMAPKLSMTEDNVWIVEQATAVAYAKDGSETTFEAGAGKFDDNSRTAELNGGVRVTFGSQVVEMQDMRWTNETHTAQSDQPVKVTDGETNLSASSMEYRADTKVLLLRGLTGTVSMKGAAAQ